MATARKPKPAPDHGRKPKKQTARLLKCQCAACGYIVRVTAKWLNDVGEPCCPLHGEMECV